MTTTIHDDQCAPRLLMAIELGRREWKLAFATGVGQAPRRRTLRAESWARVTEEIAAAKVRFGVGADMPVISCYEAGLDGFWVHRYLISAGVQNLVVDSSSIEVNRRARRAKTDRLDVERLLALLLRYVSGERSALRVLRIPSEADEQRRQLHRELLALKRDRTRVTNRITGLLATQGIRLSVRADFRTRLDQLTDWDGRRLPAALQRGSHGSGKRLNSSRRTLETWNACVGRWWVARLSRQSSWCDACASCAVSVTRRHGYSSWSCLPGVS